MMLTKLKAFVRQQGQANLLEIARHLETDPKAVKPMLDHWIRKGQIQPAPKPNGCGVKCVKCEPIYAEVYCWVG